MHVVSEKESREPGLPINLRWPLHSGDHTENSDLHTSAVRRHSSPPHWSWGRDSFRESQDCHCHTGVTRPFQLHNIRSELPGSRNDPRSQRSIMGGPVEDQRSHPYPAVTKVPAPAPAQQKNGFPPASISNKSVAL